MTLQNPLWITFSGDPVTGRTPTRVQVVSDPPGLQLTGAQQSVLAAAYVRFCASVRTSPFPDGYHVRDFVAPGGMAVRLVSNGGVHKIVVRPRGGEEPAVEEEFLLASPRVFGGTFVNGDPSKPVYAYQVSQTRPPTQKKAQVLPAPGQYANLQQQPGCRVWRDDRKEGRQISSTVTWWGRVHTSGTEAVEPSLDRTVPLNGSRTWYTEFVNFSLYVDYKRVGALKGVGISESLLCAALHLGTDGQQRLRVVTVGYASGSAARLRLYELLPADIEDQSKYTVTAIPVDFLAVRTVGAFNASATRFCYIGLDPGNSYAQCVMEVDFATGTFYPSEQGNAVNESVDYDVPTPRSTLTNFEGYTTSSQTDTEDGYVYAFSGTKPPGAFVLKRHLTRLWTHPVACAYIEDDLVWVSVRDRVIDHYDMSDNHHGSMTHTRTYSRPGGVGDANITYEGEVNVAHVRGETRRVWHQTTYTQHRGAESMVLHDSGSVMSFDWRRDTVAQTNYGWDVSITTSGSDNPSIPANTFDTSSYHDEGGFGTGGICRKTCLAVWEPAEALAVIVEAAVSLQWKSGGRYLQRLRVEHTHAGVSEVFESYHQADTPDFLYVAPASGPRPDSGWPIKADRWEWGEETISGFVGVPVVGPVATSAPISPAGLPTIRLGSDYSDLSDTPPAPGPSMGRQSDFEMTGALSYASAVGRPGLCALAVVAAPDAGVFGPATGRIYDVRPVDWFPGVLSSGYESSPTYGLTLCHITYKGRILQAKTAVHRAIGPLEAAPTATTRYWWNAPLFLPKGKTP